MILEKSCGAVVYCEAEEGRLYLLEHMVGGHYAMCKGHVEGNETESETAIREIREETGITVTLDTGFRETVTYSPRPGHMKDVIYFIGRADSMDTVNQPEEVQGICWLPYGEAMKRITFGTDKAILEKAEKYLAK